MTPAHLPSCIIPCKAAHLVYLAGHMRLTEQEQFLAVTGTGHYNPEVGAHWLINIAARSGGFAFTALQDDNTPAAAGGFEPVSPGVWQSWMVGTEDGWAQQWRSLTKAARWTMERVFESGAHRVQTTALVRRREALVWFQRSLGMRPEGVWRAFGANGEDFASFSRLRGE
ncbi:MULTISPECIES: hypothetical protein [Xanthomonas]|uniref:Uncharacterized protein n=1 Tax=Xanthomonas dyei TaxID=743699 RepID=A0ABZ0D3M2_9XANT|nr:hypothetical protein [Xanthomonas dyei]WOB24746.1 hypothetical protein NYR99_13150 [Xanthomonas dyei]WOB52375.1 hypothetical protein NYR95_13155 [Xanthomonas dyei]